MSGLSCITLLCVNSFQRSWTKFQYILESSARTPRVSVTHSACFSHIAKTHQCISMVRFCCIFCFLIVSGPVEADPEYRLIVAANNLTVEIDNELSEFTLPF